MLLFELFLLTSLAKTIDPKVVVVTVFFVLVGSSELFLVGLLEVGSGAAVLILTLMLF